MTGSTCTDLLHHVGDGIGHANTLEEKIKQDRKGESQREGRSRNKEPNIES